MLESLPNTQSSASKTSRDFNETLEAFKRQSHLESHLCPY
jgi:hypothetical protein